MANVTASGFKSISVVPSVDGIITEPKLASDFITEAKLALDEPDTIFVLLRWHLSSGWGWQLKWRASL